jgi:hypothetical protein
MPAVAPDLDLLAHHEAAHAVVLRHFGVRLARIWIDPTGERGGETVHEADQAPTDPQQPFIVGLAGGCAEMQLDPQRAHLSISTIKDVVEVKEGVKAWVRSNARI